MTLPACAGASAVPSRLALGVFALLPMLLAPTAPAQPRDPSLRVAAALYDGIRTATLANGLRVFIKPVPESPVVTTMVAYKVGSADEDLNATGLSHYLEHLMFKGTDKLMPGDIDRLTMRAGGRNNAYTSEDYTVFHFDFAADQWDAGLKVEADRMRNLRIDAKHEFEQEKGAVISELDRDEDQPFDLEQKEIVPLLFGKTAPYGHPVIGEREHVRAAKAEVIKAHYDKWYHPNNAVLVVCGAVDPDQAIATIRTLFEPIPAATLPPRKPVVPAQRSGPVRKEIPSKFEVPRLVMGFNTVRTGDPDYYALEVVQALLSGASGGGKTSRLYQRLVEGEEIANAISCGNNTGRYPGWFSVQAELLKGKPRERAEELILAEMKRLADEPVSAVELKRVQRGLLAGTIFGREGVHELADSIARGVTTNDLEFLKTYLPRINAVTAADVQAAARKYLDPQRRVAVWSVPEVEPKGKGESPGKPASGQPPARKAREPKGTGPEGFSLKATKRVVLPNGLTLLMLENHRLPIVVAASYVRGVRASEPAEQSGLATLAGSLLDEGTAAHSGPEIATLIEDAGGEFAMSATGGSVRVLTPDRSLGLGLLFDSLIRPTFPKEALARKREQILSAIDDSEQRPDGRASRLFHELVFGPRHPLGRPQLGKREIVAKLTEADCKAFHAARFLPNATLVSVVGDFNADELVAEITRLTAGWKSGPPPKPDLPPVEKPAKFTQKVLSMPATMQLYFYMGHLGIRRDNPDYYKLLVMDYVLGTGPGFTDRLSSQLRDREGLAYTVSATITPGAAELPGAFTCYIGTFPDKFTAAKDGFMKELTAIRAEPPTAEEVDDAKRYLIGSLPFAFANNGGVAGQLLQIERFGLGFGYLDDYRKAVAAVTPADVLAVARKYLDPEHMVLVAAGPVDAAGKPLAQDK